MKYTIARHFSLKNERFDIIRDAKNVCTVKAAPSKEHKGQFDVKLLNPSSKYLGNESCIIELDSNNSRRYLIYLQNNESKKKTLFGQLFFELDSYNNYLYTIIIGRKLYKVRSCDLKDRRLAIVDMLEPNDPSQSDQYSTLQYPKTLFQVIDSFSKSNQTYHVTIDDKQPQLGYLAMVILLDLHECKRG